jgi:hypothetical protein
MRWAIHRLPLRLRPSLCHQEIQHQLKKLGDLTFDMFFTSKFLSDELFTNPFFIGKILVSISN